MRPLRPHMLWIVTTQWRGQACGFAGDPNAHTPQLDAFARDAAVFDQAFSNHPFGPFARAALLTGRYSPANGVADYWDPLPRSTRTVAHLLQESGYNTAFFGKWHLSRRDPRAPVVGEAHARQIVAPEDRGGFAFWEGFESGFLLNHPWLHGTRLPTPAPFSGYQSDVLCERAAEWLRAPVFLDQSSSSPTAAADRPWFCVVSLEAPHPPYDAAVPEDIGLRPPADIVLAPNVPDDPAVQSVARRELAGYYAHIAATDRALGRLLATVDRDRTAVFITSVHGDLHGAHGLFRKGWPFEESIRVPLLAAWPGLAPHRIHTPVSLVDLPFTALALAGAAPPAAWAGADLRQLGPTEKRTVLLGMPSVPPFTRQCPQVWRGLRTENELFAVGADGRPWLHFDLATDPGQFANLLFEPDSVDAREKLTAELVRRLAEAGDSFAVVR